MSSRKAQHLQTDGITTSSGESCSGTEGGLPKWFDQRICLLTPFPKKLEQQTDTSHTSKAPWSRFQRLVTEVGWKEWWDIRTTGWLCAGSKTHYKATDWFEWREMYVTEVL